MTLNHRFTNTPELTVSDAFTFSVESLLSPVIERLSNSVSNEVDKELRKLNLQREVEELWFKIQEPILLLDEPDVFLYVTPHSLSLQNPIVGSEGISSVIKLDADLLISTGQQATKEKTQIPPLIIGPIVTPGISAYIEFSISDDCLLYTSPSPRDATLSRMPSSA